MTGPRLRIDDNERPRPGLITKPLWQVRREAMAFVMQEAGFAQVTTVSAAGFPVSRTMGVPLNDDWSVELIQRSVHARLAQLRSNPRVEIIWSGSPAPGSVNDRPHVYDFGLLVPRVVFLRGIAEFMPDEWTVQRFRARSSILRQRGHTRAPERSTDNIRAELVGVRVLPIRVRCEGFGTGAQSYTWSIEGHG